MYCRNCGEYIADDMLFCPRCGYQVQRPKKICYYCKNPLKENETICPCCGKSQQIKMSKEDDPYKGYWKKPVLWIILVVLFAGAIFISEYITNHPIKIGETTNNETMKITGKMSNENVYANNQYGGYVVIDETSIYCVKNNKLYVASIDKPNEMKKIIDDCQGYLSIDHDKIYYCDIYDDYYSYDLKTKEKEKILENIYYPVVIDSQLYYQLDEDNESIHRLDLNTKEDKKYNDSTSYDISIDVENEKIYYLSYVDEKYTIKRIGFNGEDDENVYDCHNSVSFVLDDENIYIYDNEKIIKVNKDSKKVKVLKDDLSRGYLNICNDKLIFSHNNLVYVMSKDGKDEKEIYSDLIVSMQSVGNYVVLESYYDRTICILDLNGNKMDLFEQSEIEEFEDLEEV